MRKPVRVKKGRSKYRNVKVTIDGVRFDSKREAARYADLKNQMQAGVIRDLQIHPRLTLKIGGVKICDYLPDFVYVECETGRKVTEDVKGVLTAVYRLKKKLVKALLGIDITEV